MADLRMEVNKQGFYIEPLTDRGVEFVNGDGYKPQYSVGDHVDYPMIAQDVLIHEAEHEGLVIES
jgi:hypothetical protein